MQNHIASLRAKHAEIEHQIELENGRPAPDDYLIARLKKQKLRIKEEMIGTVRA